ncbi:MAG: hypothetical protein ACKOYK_03285, partial [Cyanobium sp.]
MCTTLTLDDDLAEALNPAAWLTGRSFKAVVNDTPRRGLAQSGSGTPALKPFVVEPQSCGWMARRSRDDAEADGHGGGAPKGLGCSHASVRVYPRTP